MPCLYGDRQVIFNFLRHKLIHEKMDRWLHGQINVWMDRRTIGRRMDVRDGWRGVDGWMGGRNGWTDG